MLLLLLLLCRYTKPSCILNGENPLPALRQVMRGTMPQSVKASAVSLTQQVPHPVLLRQARTAGGPSAGLLMQQMNYVTRCGNRSSTACSRRWCWELLLRKKDCRKEHSIQCAHTSYTEAASRARFAETTGLGRRAATTWTTAGPQLCTTGPQPVPNRGPCRWQSMAASEP